MKYLSDNRKGPENSMFRRRQQQLIHQSPPWEVSEAEVNARFPCSKERRRVV